MATTSSITEDLLAFSDSHRDLYGDNLRTQFQRSRPAASAAVIDVALRHAVARATEETTKARQAVDAIRGESPPAAIVRERLRAYGLAMRCEDRLTGHVRGSATVVLPWEDAVHRGDLREAYEIAARVRGESHPDTLGLLRLLTSP